MTGETDKYIKAFDPSSTQITVYEDIPVGHKLGTLHIDAQPGDSVQVTQADASAALLQLDFNGTNTEMNVWTKSGLDYEQDQADLSLGVSLNGGSTSFIIIKLLDVNDNPPEFVGTGSQVNLNVPENQLNDSLLILSATDDDIGATATLTYSLDTEYPNKFKLLQLPGTTPSCQLQLVEELDYETRQLYRLTITAKDVPDDRGNTQSTSVTVFVNVEDDSDSPPRWLVPPLSTSKEEGLPKGGELFTVEAIDGDTMVNNKITYSIVSQNPDGMADIDPATGKVTLLKELNREDKDIEDGYITIDVQAMEVQSAELCTNITCVSGTALITVIDIDDNDPELDKSSYTIEVPENTSGPLGLSITVTDKDPVPPNGLISMSLVGAPEGVFEVTSEGGSSPLITDIRVLNRDYLDYEKEDRRIIKFTVVATGDNDGKRATSSEVTVTLTDTNDETPVFAHHSFTANVSEASLNGTFVVKVLATDADSTEEYGNDSIRYTLSGGGGKLRDAITVDAKTGEVTLADNAPFDYEDGDHTVEYTVRATDMKGDAEGNTASAPLTITVIDVDDSQPKLTVPPGNVEVLEETKDIVVTNEISAEDDDNDAQLEFRIDWEQTEAKKDSKVVSRDDYDYTKLFKIESSDKKATLSVDNGGPDRERIDTITLFVIVNDTNTEAGPGTATGPITVTILDINDNAPTFTSVNESTEFSIIENSPRESLILPIILAKDIDQNNTVTYSLSGDPTFTDLVGIDKNSGQLSVKGTIDRETNPYINLTLTATDAGVPPKSTSMEISIKVKDQNDNRPKWIQDPNSLKNLTVLEGDPSASVFNLTASDDDEPDTPASSITYFISEDGKLNFTVDPVTGEVKVKDTLDREKLADQNYVMTVRVSAGDQCDNQGQCVNILDGLLSVKVLDVNDCPPVFPERSDFLAEVPETTPADNDLNTVKATDADQEGTLATQLTYSLQAVTPVSTGCDDTDLFTVTTDTGNNQAKIVAKRDLQGCWGVYNITLAAMDGEAPFNNGTGMYQVHVKDVNDKPTIDSPEDGFPFDIAENSYDDSGNFMPIKLPNGTLLKVQGSDPDIPDTDNSRLSYRILGTSSPDTATSIFDIDKTSGQVQLKSQIDRESRAGYIYQLVVEVTDDGNNGGLSDQIVLNVTVSDVDEYPPRFEDRYNNDTSFVEENAPGDTAAITSVATDDDDTDIIFYYLVGGATDTFELVDSAEKTPHLRTKKRLDREKQASYQLILQTTNTNNRMGLGDVDQCDPENPAQLCLNIGVQDINDCFPSFGNRRFMGGVASGDPKSMTVLTIESDDPDLGDVILYTITSDFTASDGSIANISKPFVLKADTGELSLNFDVSTGMQGYFDFAVTATDAVGHSNITDPAVRVFIITEDDRVKFVFANQYAFVQARQDQVADILTDAFSVDGKKYVASVESVTACTSDPECTNMITHFIDDDKTEPVPADLIINLQFKGDISNNLIKQLGAIQLNLTAIGDTTVTPEEDDETVFQMLLIVVASVLGGILALTLITSCIHTAKLRRQVKALSINAFGSKESGLQNAGLAVPGSNMFANQGANPIFTMDDKRPIDAESVSSGDSVLIGVEDAPEFSSGASRPAQKRPAPSAPLAERNNPAFQPDDDDDDEGYPESGLAPAVFDENSHHHMPTFDVDDDGDAGSGSPFGGESGLMQNPLFGAGEGGATQNPLFGAGEGGATQNPLFGAGDGGATQNPLFGADASGDAGGGDLF